MGANEEVRAEWLGEKVALVLDPAPIQLLIRNWYSIPPDDPRPFIVAAAVRITGFRIGVNQDSIVSRVKPEIIGATHHAFVAALVHREVSERSYQISPHELLDQVMILTKRLTDTFYANRASKPSPHWYVGKEACSYVQGPETTPNPEEIMRYADFLSKSMTGTKGLLDDLLDNSIVIIL